MGYDRLDPEVIRRKAKLTCAFYPRFKLQNFPENRIVPVHAPSGELWWYARNKSINGLVRGPEEGAEYYNPYIHYIRSPDGTLPVTIRNARWQPVAYPVPLWIRLWNLDNKPVISVHSAGHEEYYILLLEKWYPPGESVFQGLNNESIILTFHPQHPE